MNRSELPSREYPEMRTFRICLDRPQPRTTILGIVGRLASDPAISTRTDRHGSIPRPTSAFA